MRPRSIAAASRGAAVAIVLAVPVLISGGPGPSRAAAPDPRDSTAVVALPEVRVEAPRRTVDTGLPLATTVIDRAAIDASGALNLGQILRPVVGVRVATTGGLGSFTPISIRGSSNDQVLVLVDGRRLNAAQGGGVDLADIPLDNLERIEVVRGGASAIHGADAIGGTINLVTRTVPPGTEAGGRLEYGSFDTRLLSAHLADGRYDADWRLDGRLCLSDGPVRTTDDRPAAGNPDAADGTTGRGDLDSKWLSGRVGWQPAWASHLDLSASHESSEKGVPGSTEFTSVRARQSDEFSAMAVELEGLAVGGPWLAGATASTGARVFGQRRRRGFADPDHPLGSVDDRHRNDSWGIGLDHHRDLGAAGRLHAGLDWRRDELISSTDGHRRRGSVAAWARQAMTLGAGGRFELTPALRWDRVEGLAGRWSPMLMARHRLSDAVRVRASVGAAFRPPSFDDLFQPPRASAAGNPNLKAEQSWHGDLGATLTRGAWSFGLTGFVNRIHDLIQWQPGAAGIWRPHNVDGARIAGVEAEATGGFRLPGAARAVTLNANYTWLDPRESGEASNTAGNVLVYRPRHKVNGEVRVPIGAFEVETQWAYTGPVFTTRANTKSLSGYVVGDAGLRWTLRSGLELDARLLNLTDVAYQDFRDYPAPGREWRLAVVGRLGR